jgi:hypothetical protein
MVRRVLKYPVKVLDGLADRVIAVLGAITFSQVPGFITHYLQRLGGHVSEAQQNIASWQGIADETAGGSLRQLIELYQSAPATEVIAAGRKCAGDVARLHDLRAALDAIRDASPWERMFTFVRYADTSIAQETLASYVPNVPLDLESLVYGCCGLLVAFGLYQGAKGSARLAIRRHRIRARARKESRLTSSATPGMESSDTSSQGEEDSERTQG